MDMKIRKFLTDERGKLLLVSFSAAFVSLLVYLPSLGNDFVNWDDSVYVYDNQYVKQDFFDFIKWMFASVYSSNWHPLLWLSFKVDYALWELNPFGYHLSNVLLHGANVLLVVLLTGRLLKAATGIFDNRTVTAAALAGAVFGLHPLHVESVAWISGRKDVLYAFFWLLSLLAYVKYVERRKASRYIVCLGAFCFSLMSKPMAVTLPVVLLALDYYPLRRLNKKDWLKISVLEKLPFFVLSGLDFLVTVYAQSAGGALTKLDAIPLWQRGASAIKALGFYLYKFALPFNLSPYYPLSLKMGVFSLEFALSFAAVAAATAIALLYARKQPVIAMAWGYYIATLLPVLGFFQTGTHAAADRFMYMPVFGPVAVLAAIVVWAGERLKGRARGFAAAGVLFVSLALAGLSVLSVKQARVWKDSFTLWSHAIELYPESLQPYAGRGKAFLDKGDHVKAIEDFTSAIARGNMPYAGKTDRLFKSRSNRGLAYIETGNYEAALNDFDAAIGYSPGNAALYFNKGIALGLLGRLEEAVDSYRHAVSLDPDFPSPYNNLAKIYTGAGKFEEAIVFMSRAIALEPSEGGYYFNRGLLYEITGRNRLAFDDYESSSRLGNKKALEKLLLRRQAGSGGGDGE
jgi:tetratricopeptide (TPR) repeat protein